MKTPFQSNSWIGRLIGERQRYRLDKCLAADGMGEVFLATDTLLGHQVALKLLKDTLIASADLRKRFEWKVALCRALKSVHIVEVSDYGVTAEGYPFFIMEYLRGQSLGQLLRQKQRLPLEQTVNLIAQVCDGLQVAHAGVTIRQDNATVSEQIKVVHRDLKPDNIFLVPTALGELVKILNLGVAKIRETRAEHTNLMNTFLGKFHYAAPEQLEVEKDLDGRTDIYSLGIIIYEMLSGTDPFGLGFNVNDVSINNMSWALAHTSKPPVPLRSQPGLSQISLELEAVVMRCLKKTPDERFASVDELKQAMLAAIPNTYQSQQLEQIKRIIDDANYGSGGSSFKNVAPTEPQVPEKHIGETRVGDNQKKTRQLLLKTTAVATTLVGVGLAYYYCTKGRIDQSQKTVLETIQLLKSGKNYEECVNQAKAVLPTSSFYHDAQNLLNECQRLAQDDKLLAQAKKLAQKNDFKDAISEASKIQPDSSLHPLAQPLIDDWSLNLVKQAQERYRQALNSKDVENAIALTKAIPQTSSVAKSAEALSEKWRTEWKNNENYLKAATDALKQGKRQEAIDKTHRVRILGQKVKHDTPYWQKKMKPIIGMAQKRIADGEIPGGSGTNNPPELPPPQPIPSPVSYQSKPAVPPQPKSPVSHQSKPAVPPQPKSPVSHQSKSAVPPQPKSPVPEQSNPAVPPQPNSPVSEQSKPAVPPQPNSPVPEQSSPPKPLPPEAQRILCQQFPLNSRCGSKP